MVIAVGVGVAIVDEVVDVVLVVPVEQALTIPASIMIPSKTNPVFLIKPFMSLPVVIKIKTLALSRRRVS
jgi:hypothetical protein